MTSEEGVEKSVAAMDKVIDWLESKNIDAHDAHPIRDFGIAMFKIGMELGLSGIDYKTFNDSGKKSRYYHD